MPTLATIPTFFLAIAFQEFMQKGWNHGAANSRVDLHGLDIFLGDLRETSSYYAHHINEIIIIAIEESSLTICCTSSAWAIQEPVKKCWDCRTAYSRRDLHSLSIFVVPIVIPVVFIRISHGKEKEQAENLQFCVLQHVCWFLSQGYDELMSSDYKHGSYILSQTSDLRFSSIVLQSWH